MLIIYLCKDLIFQIFIFKMEVDNNSEKVAILDAGAQYGKVMNNTMKSTRRCLLFRSLIEE